MLREGAEGRLEECRSPSLPWPQEKSASGGGMGDVDLALDSRPKFPASILKDSFLLFSPKPSDMTSSAGGERWVRKTSAFVRASQGTNDWSKSTERGKVEQVLQISSGASISSRGPCQPGQMMREAPVSLPGSEHRAQSGDL